MAASTRCCCLLQTSLRHALKRPSVAKSCLPIYQIARRSYTIQRANQAIQMRPSVLGIRQLPGTGKPFLSQCSLSTESETTVQETEEYHTIIKNTEQGKGPTDKHEFQAETRKLLDIVAKSLYSDKEVFIRELISNASDALERLRYLQLKGEIAGDEKTTLEIHIATDDVKKTFTIQDTGIGLTRNELIDNLGTIAKSGSKAFLEHLKEESAGDVGRTLIGQFGVGFYSTFMVGDTVEVYTRSYHANSPGLKWTSDGSGTYEVSEADGVQRGTKIVVHLKGDCYDFAKEDVISGVVKRYSNFVGVPIYLNGHRVNILQALWMTDPRDVTETMHEEFYRFIANAYDKPRYHFHYKTDAPLNIRALFYVPEYKPTLFDMSRETDSGLTLYSRRVMIMAKANNILPKWMRFIRGVVDSEDIPLNLSRELLQESALIRKLREVLTNRVLRFFADQAKKEPEKYMSFYDDYGLFFREGIVTTADQNQREAVAKLLRFESSKSSSGERISLDDYASRMKAGERNIYFLAAPSRHLAETSPYYEAFRKRDIEVLFLYEAYDELVLMNLAQYDRKNLRSIENELHDDKENTDTVDTSDLHSLSKEDAESLKDWLKGVLLNRVNNIKMTRRLESHPCVITVQEMGAARHFLRTTLADKSQEERLRLLQPTLELNPSHSLVKKLSKLKSSDPQLAEMLAQQLYENAMINAGLIEDARLGMERLHHLLDRALESVANK
ncbi:heat shock protein 75 kDa, mitochondrial-like [Pomacea canaliculata]|uniref:heat shock protein 75 kDa, mitochondrial-like n=1 Tax=Pomacea canaliculata TaxID=400727 RepID=UPI000D726DEC|nr:heat shock protein 75 kDa, mitochondrial-like [Pomacea canaliculata]